jgi:quercetin dioxygenase-like cupin family protein
VAEEFVMIAVASVGVEQRVRYGAGGAVYRIVTTPAETGGHHFAFEAIEPPGGGPPLHTHANEEEFFWVLEGEISFYIDGQVTRVPAGGNAFVRRGQAHCFKNCSDRQARVLILFTPGQIEPFFEYGAAVDGQPPSEELMLQRLIDLAPRHGLAVLGPNPL